MTEQEEYQRNLDEALERLRVYLRERPPQERPGQWRITYIGAPRYFQTDEVL